jgi:hypothetical protein
MVRSAFVLLAAAAGCAALTFAASTNAGALSGSPKGRTVTQLPKGAKLVVRSHKTCYEAGCGNANGNGTCVVGYNCQPTPESVICTPVYGHC